MATGDEYILPWQISSTEFILYESQKFSKSRKIGVWVDEALEIADADYWRYILMALRPENKDANFTWKEFQSRINVELNDVLGNFIYRTLSFIKSKFNSKIPKMSQTNNLEEEIIKLIEDSPNQIGKLMDKVKIREALSGIIEMARKGNQYMSMREPWQKIKTDLKSSETTLNLCAQLVYSISILLWPFIPRKTQDIRNQLNFDHTEKLRWDDAGRLRLTDGHMIGSVQPLFKKIEFEKLLDKVDEIRKKTNE